MGDALWQEEDEGDAVALCSGRWGGLPGLSSDPGARILPAPWELEAWSVFEGRHRQHANGEALHPHLAQRSKPRVGGRPHKMHAARVVRASSGQIEQPVSRRRLQE
jgi:hypothetical protein